MESKRCYGCMQYKEDGPFCEHCGYDERRQNAPHQLPVGTVLQGKYLVGRVLGQGGFGITYLGLDMTLDIPVAIKEYYPTGVVTRECSYSHSVTLATGTEDTRFVENRDRFLREARILAKLQDVPEVVRIKTFFTANNTAYIVMDYVQGITLKEHMRRSGGRLSSREVFRLLEPVMNGLGQVHGQGLVHRDISPDNIMLQPNGKARLIDFGAAHAATAAGDKSTQAVLKHGFAPLEQYQRKGNLGPWTDVYAMCATVYHCITGLMPPNVADRIVGEEEFQWEALAGLTRAQLTALKQGLAPQYKQRIQTMEELCAKLFDREEPAPQSAPMPAPIPRPQPQPVPEPKPVPHPEPKPAPKPQPRQEEPSVSETGTIALVREQPNDVPAILTAPVDNKQSIHTAPALRQESYTAPVVQEQQQKKKPWIWIAAGVLAGLLLLFVSVPPATPQSAPHTAQPDVPQYTDPNEPQTIQETYGSRVLMNPQIVWKEVSDGESTWTEFDVDANYAFGTKALRKDIASITFLDNVKDAPSDAVDASKNQDGSVLAWVIPNGELYDLYIAADGPIILPQDCNSMFAGFSALTELDVSGFDTGNVTNMGSMFNGCSNLTELDVSGFDTGNVTDMGCMFFDCSKLTELDVSGFDTGNVTNMDSMFDYCSNLTELDVSGFDTGNVTSMSDMFYCCYNLTELDVSGFDTGNVTSMSDMFYCCTDLTGLDLSGFDTGNVTDMGSMFYGCTDLTGLDLSGFDTGNVTNMGSMFYNCTELTELDVSGFDTGNVTDMSFMFYLCYNLTGLDVSGFDTGNVTNMGSMFARCDKLTELDLSGFDTGNVTNMGSMFAQCEKLTKLDVSGFDTGNVTDMESMFSYCKMLPEVDVSGFDTGNVTSMRKMFSMCYRLTELDVSDFNTGKVTNMDDMFYNCSELTGLDVSGFDTGNVTNMSGMFYSCSGLRELDVSGFDTGNVTYMGYMFFYCSKLTRLDVSGFDTGNVTDMSGMFYGTDKLKNVNGNFDVRNVKQYSYFMDSGDTFNGRTWEKLFQ